MNNKNDINILICDANFCTIPILEALKKKGFKVYVCGIRKTDPCHALADKSIEIDYSNHKLLLNIVEKNNITYIVSGCNDASYLSSAWVAEILKLPGYDNYQTTLLIHHKDKFRSYCQLKKHPIPKSVFSLEKAKKLKFPLLIKPTDSFSGKGIEKVFNKTELESHYNKAVKHSTNKNLVIEEFVTGKLYSHSAFIKKGKIIIDFFVNEYCTVYPYQVNSSNLTSSLNENIKDGIREWVKQFANDLKLCDGLIHTQFISDNQQFWLIEVARRCPGDLYSTLILLSTGVNYAALYSLSFCNIKLPDKVTNTEMKYMSRHTVSTNKDCIFISSNLALNNAKIFNVQLKNSGQIMKKAPYDKSGIYFIEHDSLAQMENITERLFDYINIETLSLKINNE